MIASRLAELVMAVTVLEAAFLVWRGTLPARQILPNLAAGLLMVFAVRLAAGGAAWPWIAVSMAGSGAAHLLDLASRGVWRRPSI